MKNILRSYLIKSIVNLELSWFKSLKSKDTHCQENEESFKRIRSVTFETWSIRTLYFYLRHLKTLKKEGRNPVAEKYLIMDGKLPLSSKKIVEEIVNIESKWMEDVRSRYPQLFKEDVSYFKRYLSAELSTYSNDVLESYLDDLKRAIKEDENLVERKYELLARSMGFASLQEMADSHR